jgi:pyruvate dehydrogenase E1 component alpha subunit
MDNKQDINIAKEVLRLRLSQMIVNEKYKAGLFKIPIHLAMGHEAIAVAMDAVMEKNDRLVCSHRNIHYNLARAKALKPILDEYLLKKEGLASAELGSMNLANEEKQLVYTSSILGNNLSVATGIALGQKVKESNGAVFVVTGDGAMEEGTFYESLLFAKSNALSLVVIVENNNWSMHTKIEERRSAIDMPKLAASLGADYEKLSGNDVYDYIERLGVTRKRVLENKSPFVLEVDLSTLGGWHVEEGENKRFVHPHAGPLSKTNVADWPQLEDFVSDPVFVLQKHFAHDVLSKAAQEIMKAVKAEIGE